MSMSPTEAVRFKELQATAKELGHKLMEEYDADTRKEYKQVRSEMEVIRMRDMYVEGIPVDLIIEHYADLLNDHPKKVRSSMMGQTAVNIRLFLKSAGLEDEWPIKEVIEALK